MSEARITAVDLGKSYAHRAAGRFAAFAARVRRSTPRHADWALRDVSFSVKPGEMLGVIGSNGAGKSTLLSLLGGVIAPTSGHVAIHGRIGALLELGGGFVDDLTGRENAVMAGVVAGLTRSELHAQLDAIVSFAEIGRVLDEPVRTYSTGMRMRLAFAVAVHTDPEVLLVDEYLAVGDLSFQARCRARIAEFQSRGCAVVLVSHALADVRDTCDRVLWLHDGAVAALDKPRVVTELYEREMHQRTLACTPPTSERRLPDGRKLEAGQDRLGSLAMEIASVTLSSGQTFRSGDPLAIEITYRTQTPVDSPIFGVSITRDDGTLCLDTNTESARISTEHLPRDGRIVFSVTRLELGSGRYFVNVGVFEAAWKHAYDYHWQVYPLLVAGPGEHKGIVAPPCRWDANPPRHSSDVESSHRSHPRA